MIGLLFEWDENKNLSNLKKHKIDFETAARVFADPNRIERFDWKHSIHEERYITIGEIYGTAYIVVVVYTERNESIRIISARKATQKERSLYYDC